MLFNAEKSEHLSISSNGRPDSNEITMGNTKIPKVSSHKHLGVTVQNTLKWTEHIKNIYTTCARKIGILRRLRKMLHPSIFKKIYVGVIRPKLEYGCAIWSGGPTSKLLNLQRTFVNGITFPFLHYRNDSITLHLCYFSKYACVKPKNSCTTSCQTPRLALGTIFARVLTRCLQSVGHLLLLPSCHEQ